MLRPIQIIREGFEYPDGRIIAIDAITWRDPKLPVYQMYTQKLLCEIFNLRREGKYIVGDCELEFDPDLITPFLTGVKVRQTDTHMLILEGVLRCVYVKKPITVEPTMSASQFFTNTITRDADILSRISCFLCRR